MGVYEFDASADVKMRAMDFLDAYIEAPGDAELGIMAGHSEDGRPAMVITLCGRMHGFTVDEARIVADIASTCVEKFPGSAEPWRNLVAGLREAADRCENAIN